MDDVWALTCPCTGGKRPRSPVEKLADLQGLAEDDDAHWRSSKRFFTEVIASGFSRLTFGKGLQQQGCDEQDSMQLLSITSPKGHAASNCYVQLPGALLSPKEDSACDMNMQTSPNMRKSLGSTCNRAHRPESLATVFSESAGSPVCSPAANSVNHSPIQYPFGSYSSPTGSSGDKQLPPPAWQLAAGCIAAPAAVPPALPKVLKAAEKPPNSPSDLPASGGNLRKVALLRSLLARTEQHLQQHQQEQQQQQLQPQQHLPDGAHHHHHHQQQQQQQQQHAHATLPCPHREPPQPDSARAAAVVMEGQHLQDMHMPAVHQGHEAATAAAHKAACAMINASAAAKPAQSDDMDCSSSACSSFAGSDSSDVSDGRPVLPDTTDLAATSLLCTEVLPLGNNNSFSWCQQQQQSAQHHQYAFCVQHWQGQQRPHQQQEQPVPQGSIQQWPGHAVCPQHTVQPQSCFGSVGGAQTMLQPPHTSLQQQQPPMQQAKPLKVQEILSRDRLEALRAKALASTCNLTDLEPEDLHSLQLSITASKTRRGSADHTPSHLHTQTTAEARRHSSHI